MRSDLTTTAGRFWSPDSVWNRKAEPPVASLGLIVDPKDLGAPFTFMVGRLSPTVLYANVHDPEREIVGLGVRRIPSMLAGFQGRMPLVIVDFETRKVISASAWNREDDNRWTADDLDETDLDGEGWGSLAAGLILEREMIRGRIEHAVGCLLPWEDFYGRRLWATATTKALNSVELAVFRAASRHGMICVGVADRPIVLIERSAMATGPDDPGRTYRGFGLGSGEFESALRLGLFRVEG